jgi:hypothetical protein
MGKKCILQDCERKATARGLCFCHYQTARNFVCSGKATWEDLVKQGWASETKRKGNTLSEFTEKMRAKFCEGEKNEVQD